MKNILKLLFIILLACSIAFTFFSPVYLAIKYQEADFLMLMVLTWIPCVVILTIGLSVLNDTEIEININSNTNEIP